MIGHALAGLALSLALLLGLSHDLRAQAISTGCPATPSRHWEAVVPGVWVWPGAAEDINPDNHGHVASQVLIARGRSATLIDPGPGLAHGLAVIESARCELGLEISRVLDSHAHAENVLGNAAFLPRQGMTARLEATPTTRAAMTERCAACSASIARAAADPALTATPIVLPEPSLANGQRWDSDAGSWLTLEFRSAHSESDLAWWNERERLLIAPGLIYQDRLPELAQGSWLGWIAALRELHRLQPTRVAGQSPGSSRGLQATYRYLCDLGQTVRRALESGQSAAEASRIEWPAHAGSAEWAGWAGHAERHGFNLQRAWRELEPLWIQGDPLACPALDPDPQLQMSSGN